MAETINRRGRAGLALGAAAAVGIGSHALAARPPIVDPVLELVNLWNTLGEELVRRPDGEGEAFYKRQLNPIERSVIDAMPAATSPAGAAAALRKALSFGDLEEQDAALVTAPIMLQRLTVGRGEAIHGVWDNATVGTDWSHGSGWAARPTNEADGVANCASTLRDAGVGRGEFFASHPAHLPETNRRAAAWLIQDLPQ